MRALNWLFRDRRPGRDGWVLAQSPNARALLAGAGSATAAAGAALHRPAVVRPAVAATLLLSAWWAVGELTGGVNPFRRLLGAGTLATVPVAAVTLARSDGRA